MDSTLYTQQQQQQQFHMYTLHDYLNLMATIVNYVFAHEKVNGFLMNMSDQMMYTYIQLNLGVGISLFIYSYTCFFYGNFLGGIYATMLSFLCFYNVLMMQVQLFVKNQNKVLPSTPENSDDSDVSDDDEEDEEGDAFEQEGQKERSNDNEMVAQILDKVLEMVANKDVDEILANHFVEMTTENEVAEILTQEFSQNVVEETSQENIPVEEEENQDTIQSVIPDEKENSVSGTPEAEEQS